MNEINIKSNRINECIIKDSSPLENVDRIISKVSRSICKIKIETSFGTIKGTGFLLSFWNEQEKFYYNDARPRHNVGTRTDKDSRS